MESPINGSQGTGVTNMAFELSIVVPAYNEADGLEVFLDELNRALEPFEKSEIIVVDDGSRDATLSLLKRRAHDNPRLKFISLTRNFGHQSALRAGLEFASGDAVISMDADLQHPPALIEQLVERWRAGFKVVNMVRNEQGGTWFKRVTSALYYRLINAISDYRVEPGSSDFRLLDRDVVTAIRQLPEHSVFLRGLIPWLGFEQCHVRYDPDQRAAGQSKYNLGRMIRLGLAGVTSSSLRPLHLSTVFGTVMSVLAMSYAVYALCIKIFVGTAISGWTSLLISVMLLGGVQLIMLGIIGEYVGRVLLEVKGRPNFLVRESNLESAHSDRVSDRATPER
ncbi:MAG: glycosyltransferase family 2 protein [Gammaproteobacteria bacterium]